MTLGILRRIGTAGNGSSSDFHNALTCLMALAVQGSDQPGAMTDDYPKAWPEANERSERTDKEQRLAPFMELFRRVQSEERMRRYVHSKALNATTYPAELMERLRGS